MKGNPLLIVQYESFGTELIDFVENVCPYSGPRAKIYIVVRDPGSPPATSSQYYKF